MKSFYIILTILLSLVIWSCKTKKSTTDFKQTEVENVSVVDNSVVKKNLTTDENIQEIKTETTADKSFIDAWLSFESDKITITDKSGTVTEITNPRINKKQSRSNDVSKHNQIAIKKENVATSEENKQNDIAISNNRQKKSDVSEKHTIKGK